MKGKPMHIVLTTVPWRECDRRPKFLVRPGPLARLVLGGKARSVLGEMPPMGLLYISAALKQAGHGTTVIDGGRSSTAAITEKIQQTGADVVGIQCFTWTWSKAQALARTIKERCPTVKTVLGGPHATGYRAKCLEECPDLDVVVVGEGEDTMRNLCAAWTRQLPLDNVLGIIWRRDGRVVSNLRAPAVDVSNLPLPDRSALDIRSYAPVVALFKRLPTTSLFTSRGCQRHCSFCLHNPQYRARSVPQVVDEIEYLREQWGIRDVSTYDEDFTYCRDRVEEFCDLLISRKTDLTFSLNSRVDNDVDPRLLKQLRRAGCWRILFGIESGVQHILDKINKGITLAQVERAVKATRAAGIEVAGAFLFGSDGETYEDGLRTLQFACDLNLDFVSFSAITPFPGTPLYQSIEPHRLKSFDRFTCDYVAFTPESMTEEQLAYLMWLSFKKFYGRKRYMLGRLLRMRSFQDLRRNIIGLDSILRAKPESVEQNGRAWMGSYTAAPT